MLKINKCMFTGNLTKDPDYRITESQKAVASFTLAVDRPFDSSDGQEADFIFIVCWNGLADVAKNYLRKGRYIYVEGRLQVRHCDNDNGDRQWISELVASEIQFLDAPPETVTGGGNSRSQSQDNNRQQQRQGNQNYGNRNNNQDGNQQSRNKNNRSGSQSNRSYGGSRDKSQSNSGSESNRSTGRSNTQGRPYNGSGAVRGTGSSNNGNGRTPWEK